MTIQKYLTVKNIIFLILILVILKSLPQITVIALLFFASYIISCSINPLVDKLEKKIKRPIAATIVLLGLLTVFFAFFLPILFIVIKQIHDFVLILPEKIALMQHYLTHYRIFGHKLPEFINYESVIKNSSPVATGLVNQSINITMNFAQGIIFFLAICMMVFYFVMDKKEIKDYLIKLFPPELKCKASEVFDNISNKVGGYVIAQILNMVVVGLLTAVGMALIKVDYPLLLGAITGLLDIIPVIGPTIALVLCMITAYKIGWISIALAAFMFLLAQWISNNFFRPVVFGKFLNLHPLVIIFAFLISAQFLGVWGVILAPAIASLVCVLFDEIYVKTINEE